MIYSNSNKSNNTTPSVVTYDIDNEEYTEVYPLLPTLQTNVGMVLNHGKPKSRPYPTTNETNPWQNVSLSRFANLSSTRPNLTNRTLITNLCACTDQTVTKETLLAYIHQQKRIDIEQAVALVLSIVPKQVATALVKHVEYMFTETHMWLEDEARVKLDKLTLVQTRIENIRSYLSTVLEKNVSNEELVATLKLVRRHRPVLANCQRLKLTEELLESIDEAEKSTWGETWKYPQTPLVLQQNTDSQK